MPGIKSEITKHKDAGEKWGEKKNHSIKIDLEVRKIIKAKKNKTVTLTTL